MKIPWDLEGTPLQIKTDSALGSGERIWMPTYGDNFVSGISITFSAQVEYSIYNCESDSFMPPVVVDKIWTITKTETALIITCNGVEVVNDLFADSSNSDCDPTWGKDVEQILFSSPQDTASDFYRPGILGS